MFSDRSPGPAASGAATRWTAVGSVASAVLSSACCWLPLLLLAFGVSAAGVGAWFEEFRPYFLGGAALLLGSGFYLSYFRKAACSPDGSCSAPSPRMRRMNRVMLWTSAIVVTAFALFPSYAGALIVGTDRAADVVEVDAAEGQLFEFDVAGMHCEACAPALRTAMLDLPGVVAASVDYEGQSARVRVEPGTDPAPLLKTISEHGYEGAVR